jgi:hypothetical protein
VQRARERPADRRHDRELEADAEQQPARAAQHGGELRTSQRQTHAEHDQPQRRHDGGLERHEHLRRKPRARAGEQQRGGRQQRLLAGGGPGREFARRRGVGRRHQDAARRA